MYFAPHLAPAQHKQTIIFAFFTKKISSDFVEKFSVQPPPKMHLPATCASSIPSELLRFYQNSESRFRVHLKVASSANSDFGVENFHSSLSSVEFAMCLSFQTQ